MTHVRYLSHLWCEKILCFALRLDEADVVLFDPIGYASEIERSKNELVLRAAKNTRAASSSSLDPGRTEEISHAHASLEHSRLAWMKSLVFHLHQIETFLVYNLECVVLEVFE